MKVALLGSRPISRSCLRLLDNNPDVSVEAVVTYPPDYDSWWEGSLHTFANGLGYQCVNEDELFEFDLDYLLSIQYDYILGPDLLDHPREGALNLHQAELPRYRGCNPFSHAIMKAREDDHWRHGTTLHFMTEEIDAGDIVARKFVDITEEDTARTLYDKTEEASKKLFKEMLPKIANNEIQEIRTPQSEFDGPSYYYSRNSLDGLKHIEFEKIQTAKEPDLLAIYDRIRGLDFPPFDPAYTTIGDQKIYLTKTSYESLLG